MKKLSFQLQNRVIQFDEHGDPPASLAVVLWRPDKNPFFVVVATFDTHPMVRLTIKNDFIPWSKNDTVSLCQNLQFL